VRQGAIDFLEKPFDDQALLDRIEEAFDASRQALVQRDKNIAYDQRMSCLTERELQVLELVIAGKTSKAIASALDISLKTVENHRHNLMLKAGVSSSAQLITWASLSSPSQKS
jgi:FixJ family two-component response regulator